MRSSFTVRVRVVSCDVPRCDEELFYDTGDGPGPLPTMRELVQEAKAAGWQVPKRAQDSHYCPAHRALKRSAEQPAGE